MWLHLPETISRFLPVWGDLTLQFESLSHALAASVSSRTKSMPQQYWRRELKKGVLTTALSGLTCELLPATYSVAEWLESSAVFPVRTSPSPADRPVSTESIPDSGLNTSESFAKCNPNGSLSKTSPQSSLFQQEELYLAGLPKAGSMRNGYLYGRPTWEPLTAGTESSYWPTARQEDAESCGNHPGAADSLTGVTRHWYTPHGMNGTDHTGKQGRGGEFARQVTQWQTPATDSFRSRGGDRKDEMGLDQQTRFWPTPTARDEKNPGSPDGARAVRKARLGYTTDLNDIVTTWPTPTAWEQLENPESFEARRLREMAKGRNGNGMGAPLDMVATTWPTPNVPNGGRTSNTTDTREDGSKRQIDLGALATHWGTPTTRDWKDGSSAEADCPTNGLLGRQVIRDFHSSPQDPEPPNSGSASSAITRTSVPPSQRRRLNVLFVTWMMGWPLFWLAPAPTVSAPAEMELWLRRQRWLLRSLLGD